ncbi:hypothetical protein [Streptomyces sp. x-80]|uniref:hypothetical protein n=1 Tax=Streptomyces sp. x-80 TaxID=2789282 RepID=UPI00397FF213
MINAPPTDDHVIVEVQVRDYGFSPAQQDEIWRRWREGQSFSLIGRALGAPMQSARRFLQQSGGVRLTPQQRSERHLSGSEREEISRGVAAGDREGACALRGLMSMFRDPMITWRDRHPFPHPDYPAPR